MSRRIPKLQVHADGSVTMRRDRPPKPSGWKPDAERVGREPWRAGAYSTGYRAARAVALDRTGGRCTDCRAAIAHRTDRGWAMDGGQVHHVVPLADGGTDEPDNLAPLCTACHRRRDEEARAARRARRAQADDPPHRHD
jgi:5-methylcytosine-specific restriction endonuclease McrA